MAPSVVLRAHALSTSVCIRTVMTGQSPLQERIRRQWFERFCLGAFSPYVFSLRARAQVSPPGLVRAVRRRDMDPVTRPGELVAFARLISVIGPYSTAMDGCRLRNVSSGCSLVRQPPNIGVHHLLDHFFKSSFGTETENSLSFFWISEQYVNLGWAK